MTVRVQAIDSILDDLERLQRDVSARAHQLFTDRGGEIGRALEDWLRAEREVVWSPPVELVQRNGQLELEVAAAGIEPRDLDIRVTSHDVVVSAPAHHRHEGQDGTVHLCEFRDGHLFRRVHLPCAVKPTAARANVENGLLHLTLPIEEEAPHRVDVQGASARSAERADPEC